MNADGQRQPTFQTISAAVLAEEESKRRETIKKLGPCKTGSSEIDDYVLLGGLPRGCVVGMSSEEEDDFGVLFGLQCLLRPLLTGSVDRVTVITPRPQAAILRTLSDATRAQARAQAKDCPPDRMDKPVRECLDKIMLSCVFDMDGLREMLTDLGSMTARATQPPQPPSQPPPQQHTETSSSSPKEASQERIELLDEIKDSQEDDESFSPPASPPPQPPPPSTSSKRPPPAPEPLSQTAPDIILITHFSTLLSTLFTQRDRVSAHAQLRLLSSQLHHLSRTLPSHPLILILNSTTTSSSSTTTTSSTEDPSWRPHQQYENQLSGGGRPSDSSLRSIFNPPPLPLPGYSYSLPTKRNKPSFGLIFTQLLDIHLLCTKVPRDEQDIELLYGGDASSSSTHRRRRPRFVTVVEVLLDEVGIWTGEMGKREDREQRWGAVDIKEGGLVVVDAFDGTSSRPHKGPPGREWKLSAGFGGRIH